MLVPVPVLVLPGVRLEAASASSVSAVVVAWLVAAAEVDGEAELEGDAGLVAWLPLAEADTDGVALADVVRLTDEVPDGDVDADFEGDGDTDFDGESDTDLEGDGDADFEGDGDADDGGEGDEVACAGRTWHTVSVAVVASGAACAPPARPRVRMLPLSRVTAAALTCAKRISGSPVYADRSGLPCAAHRSCY